MKLAYLLAAMICMFCTGCWPVRIISSPGANGTVIDSQTHAPIAGAELVVSHATWKSGRGEDWQRRFPPVIFFALTNTTVPVVITRGDGQFKIKPKYHWTVRGPMAPFNVISGTLIIRLDGYKPDMIPITGFGGNPPTALGDILLAPSLADPLDTKDFAGKDVVFADGSVLHVEKRDGEKIEGVRLRQIAYGIDLIWDANHGTIVEDPDNCFVHVTLFNVHANRPITRWATWNQSHQWTFELVKPGTDCK